MTRNRSIAVVVAVMVAVSGLAPAADAAPGPSRLQRLAVAQTKLLFQYYHGAPQEVSPARCGTGQANAGRWDVFLLPTNSFGSGNRTLRCAMDSTAVLVDLGGGVVTADARGDTYTLRNGKVVKYTRPNLYRICADAARYFTGVPASVDGRPFSGTSVVTRVFGVEVHRDASAPGLPYYQDSVDLGHPGWLPACYTGTKALLRLTPGHHVITVDLSGLTGAPTTLRYLVTVQHR